MDKVSVFKIALDKRPSIYLPGDKISGKVIIRVTESVKIENVHVNLIGDAKVHW